MSAVAKPDGRRTRHAKEYRVRIRLVPAPAGHDFDTAFETLAAIGRRSLAAKAVAAAEGKAP